MSKYGSFAEYPARSLAGAEAALLTAWSSLNRFHADMVLVGTQLGIPASAEMTAAIPARCQAVIVNMPRRLRPIEIGAS